MAIASGPLKRIPSVANGSERRPNSSSRGELFDDKPYRNRRSEKPSL